jgi:hypothetical protein
MQSTTHSETAPPPQKRAQRRWSTRVLLASALTLGAGLVIAWVDTRPHWDDTGVTAGALMLAAAAASLFGVAPWLAAALVAGPVLVAEISANFGVLLAIPFALAGAFAAALCRRRRTRSGAR